MDRGELEAAVARAIADVMDERDAVYSERAACEAAAAAIRVVLAEVTRSIEALPAITSDYDGSEGRLLDDVLAVLMALVTPPLV